jgi:hypothetical protein
MPQDRTTPCGMTCSMAIQAVRRVGVWDSEFFPHFGHFTWPDAGRCISAGGMR